jgi:hypothetical protein
MILGVGGKGGKGGEWKRRRQPGLGPDRTRDRPITEYIMVCEIYSSNFSMAKDIAVKHPEIVWKSLDK